MIRWSSALFYVCAIVFFVLLFAGCSLPEDQWCKTHRCEVAYADSEPEPAPEPIFVEPEPIAATPEPEPIGFSVIGPDQYGLLEKLLPEAVARWQAATCVAMAVAPGQHTLAYGDKTNMTGKRMGQTTGTWERSTIRVKDTVEGALRVIIAHEIAHVLSRDNGHSTDGVFSEVPYSQGHISESSLTMVCANLDCNCFVPESPSKT